MRHIAKKDSVLVQIIWCVLSVTHMILIVFTVCAAIIWGVSWRKSFVTYIE